MEKGVLTLVEIFVTRKQANLLVQYVYDFIKHDITSDNKILCKTILEGRAHKYINIYIFVKVRILVRDFILLYYITRNK